MTEAVFFHRASRTAIFADIIENLPRDFVTGWRGVAARLGGVVEPNPGAPRDWRTSFLDRKAARLGDRARYPRPWRAGRAGRRGFRAPRLRLAHGIRGEAERAGAQP